MPSELRLLHTSDWHLGRIFHGKSLLEDQHDALVQLLDMVRTTDAAALLVAGDVYDRAIPPVEAVQLLDWFLSETLLELEVPVVLIAGNHDSPERLGFGSRLLTERRLHVTSGLASTAGMAVSPLVLEDSHGPVRIYGIPYADPPLMREQLVRLLQGQLEGTEITDHESAMRAAVSAILREHPTSQRAVLVAHAFVAGGAATDSERPLSVAGAGTIAADVFAPFAYTALGHLHRPQAVGNDRVQYSGSLLRYSFSELGHDKSVSLVRPGAPGAPPAIERLALQPRRQLRQVRGLLAELLRSAPHDPRPEDFLLVTLDDEGPVLDPLGKLRPFYPNILHVERTSLMRGVAGESVAVARERKKRLSERDLFAAFFEEVTGEPLSDEQVRLLGSCLESLGREEQEALHP